MRKVLVVLLVLSVLGGAIAQEGSWSLGAGGQIGTTIDFDVRTYTGNSETQVPGDSADVDPKMFNDAYGDWWPWTDPSHAFLNLTYNRGGLSTGLEFTTHDGIYAFVSIDGDNYALMGKIDFEWAGIGGLEELWGWYKFFDGAVHLETAVISRETTFWTSGQFFFDTIPVNVEGFVDFYDNRSNFLIVDFGFSGINFGVMLPNTFGGSNPVNFNWGVGDNPVVFNPNVAVDLFEDVLGAMVIGILFAMDNVEVAGQFNMANYGAYLGAELSLGNATFTLGFEGIFDSENDETSASVGIGGHIDGGVWDAGLNFAFGYVDTDGDNPFIIGIQPSFGFNVLPDNMRFEFVAEFGFTEDDFTWRFMPELFWNFKGTGAGNFYWPMDTGVAISYLMQKDVHNKLSVVFKYGF